MISTSGNGGFETGDLTDWTLVGSTDLVFALAADDVDVAGTAALPGQPDELFVHSGLYGAYLGEWASPYLTPVPPAVGSLSQTVATTAGQQYLVSFWLTCVPDSQGVTTNNEFIAKWNNSTLYAQTNLGAFGWTNLQFVVPATTASTTLEFDFNNDPGAFGSGRRHRGTRSRAGFSVCRANGRHDPSHVEQCFQRYLSGSVGR